MNASELTGYVSHIQEYSIHDGDGIRTTVFLAGCPLRCRWCANPETWAKPGTLMTVGQVVDRVMRGAVFFRASGGGVTFSGGEATAQPEFFNALVEAFDEISIDMVLETSGHFDWEALEPALKRMSMIFLDIKHMDSVVHQQATGMENTLILENASRMATLGVPVVIRVPLIRGVNDSPENLRDTARFIRGNLPFCPVEVLPYHDFGIGKYREIGLEEPEFQVPDEEQMVKARHAFEAEGVQTLSCR